MPIIAHLDAPLCRYDRVSNREERSSLRDAPLWGGLGLLSLFSLVCLLLAGCGGSDGTVGSTTVAGMGQLLLHVTTADQERVSGTLRAVAPGQTRQTGPITLLRVAVSGPGIPTPIVAECPLPGPVTPQCEVTETPTTFLVTIALLVPVGPERLVVVTGFDQTGAESLRGVSTVDLTQPFQAVTIMLAPVQSNTPPRANAGLLAFPISEFDLCSCGFPVLPL